MSRLAMLRQAHALLLARDFTAARDAAAPFANDPAGRLLHALALAGAGAVEAAAPLLARIAAENPAANHPLQDLLPLLPPGDAAPHLRAGLRERPEDTRLLTALGMLAAERGPVEEAVTAFRRVTSLCPSDPAAWSNLGKALSATCNFDGAEHAFAAARRLAPQEARIAYNHAAMLLKARRHDEGWAALRARHALPGRPPPLPGRPLDTLDLAGQTVLLRHEEGFGDTIQFIRYAKPLAERGARVLAAVPPPLLRLIATAEGVAASVPLTSLPHYDCWVPLLDVPALLGETLPMAAPYLSPPQARPSLPPGRKIGLVWAGDPKGLLDPIRSLPVEALAPLQSVPGVTWISLQKGVAPPSWLHDPMHAVHDFADTAAILAQLDLIVAADTAVAHLAGALGRPVLLMDRHDNCWRWRSGREDSPWYPTLRIIRQTTPGDWPGVIERVRHAILSGP